MDISRKTDYALRMLAMLAEEPERLLSVRTAAEEVNVPYSFARSIQHGLVQAGIVESLRFRLRADRRQRTIPYNKIHMRRSLRSTSAAHVTAAWASVCAR